MEESEQDRRMQEEGRGDATSFARRVNPGGPFCPLAARPLSCHHAWFHGATIEFVSELLGLDSEFANSLSHDSRTQTRFHPTRPFHASNRIDLRSLCVSVRLGSCP